MIVLSRWKKFNNQRNEDSLMTEVTDHGSGTQSSNSFSSSILPGILLFVFSILSMYNMFGGVRINIISFSVSILFGVVLSHLSNTSKVWKEINKRMNNMSDFMTISMLLSGIGLTAAFLLLLPVSYVQIFSFSSGSSLSSVFYFIFVRFLYRIGQD